MPIIKSVLVLIVLVVASITHANETQDTDADPTEESSSSPWLITPLFSSDPKISTSAGALVGYVHAFDEKSPA